MSNLSAFPYIAERSEGTPGLWNYPLSIISANIAAIDSGLTLNSPSGNTFSVLTNLETSGGAHFQYLSVGSTPPSYVTTAAIMVEVNSAYSDYLYFVDSSAQKSSYVIGSRAGGLSDGLNIWDASAGTMIASFSKQSVRFFQNVVGPVFDTGGALASTYNAATFIGSGSTLSGIQACINQASIDVVKRVYLPANMYPYDASKISFIHTLLMVREGGRWDVHDVQAYGANNNGSRDATAAFQAAFNGASTKTGTAVYGSAGTYSVSSTLSFKNAPMAFFGDGRNATVITWTAAVGNLGAINFSANTISQQCVINNMTLRANVASAGSCIVATWPDVASWTQPTAKLENLEITAVTDNTTYWQSGVWLEQAWNARVNDCFIRIAPTVAAGSTGIFAYSVNATDLLVSRCFLTYPDYGIQVKGSVEGVLVSETVVIGGNIGVDLANTGIAPGYGIANSHFNVIKTAIQVTDQTQLAITGNLIYKYFSSTTDWVGIKLQGKCETPRIVGNHFNANGVSGTDNAISAVSVDKATIVGNTFEAINNNAIWFQATAQNCIAVGNYADASVTTLIYDQGINNWSNDNWRTGGLHGLADAATIAVRAADSPVQQVTLGGNRTMGAPTQATVGQRLEFKILQDGTGGRMLAWHAVFKQAWSDAGNAAGLRSSIAFTYDGTNWNQAEAQSPYV